MLQKEDYYNELYELIVDEQKFQKISRDPTTEIKTELYKIIGRINQETNLKRKKIHGHYEPGYLYENRKTHKHELSQSFALLYLR